jgi:hypothetical protein
MDRVKAGFFIATATSAMRDCEQLRDDAAECAMLAIEVPDKRTREIYVKLAQHLILLADQTPIDTFLGRGIHKQAAE